MKKKVRMKNRRKNGRKRASLWSLRLSDRECQQPSLEDFIGNSSSIESVDLLHHVSANLEDDSVAREALVGRAPHIMYLDRKSVV